MADKKPTTTSSMRVAVKSREKVAEPAPRKKPTVSSRSMSFCVAGRNVRIDR